jgi:hypothetical protein
LTLPFELDLGFVVLGDLEHGGVQEAADLTGASHVDHQGREHLLMA